MRFIGDVHAKFPAYMVLTEGCTESMQVGDFGIGFGLPAPILGPNHVFIRGNHDNPEECAKEPSYLGDFGVHKGIFFVGGAFSIDRPRRREGVDWWPNEQLTYKQMKEAGDLYIQTKPTVVVSHMCPLSVEEEAFAFSYIYRNPTHAFLESLLLWHKPKLWIFGHYHIAVDQVIDGCRYICLPELAYVDFNLTPNADSY